MIEFTYYFLSASIGTFIKIRDDISDVEYVRRKAKKVYKNISDKQIVPIIVILFSLLYLFAYYFNNPYIYFIIIIGITIPAILVPNGYNDCKGFVLILSIISIILIILNYKNYQIKEIILVLMLGAISGYPWFLNEETSFIRNISENYIKKDKEISKYKIIIRSLGSLFCIFQLIFLNRFIFHYFNIENPNSLIAANSMTICFLFYFLTSVISQLYLVRKLN